MTVDHTPQNVVVDTDVVSIIYREQGERASYYETELKPGDAWIAATALALGCPLASDDNDFREVPGIEPALILIRRPW